MQAFSDNPEYPADAAASDWTDLRTGQGVIVIEGGHPAVNGTIDAITPGATILWVRLRGPAPRRLFLCTDPVIIRPAHQG